MRQFLDYAELEAESKISAREWRRRVANGDVDVVRVGKCVRVPRSSFLAFMAARTTRVSREGAREKLQAIARKVLAGSRRAS